MSELDKPALSDASAAGALGATPGIGSALAEMFWYTRGLDRWRIRQVGEGIAMECSEASTVSRRVLEDERLVSMLSLAVESGRRSAWEAKRIAMGRLVGCAFYQDADIDELAATLVALAGLEAPHLRLLSGLAEQRPDLPPVEPYRSALVAQGTIDAGGAVSPLGRRLLEWLKDPSGG